MVKYGKLAWKNEVLDSCVIGDSPHVQDFETEDTRIQFQRVTNNCWTPWGDPDEIKYSVTVSCKHCKQRFRPLSHNMTSIYSGTFTQAYNCKCGKTDGNMHWAFESNTIGDIFKSTALGVAIGGGLLVGVASGGTAYAAGAGVAAAASAGGGAAGAAVLGGVAVAETGGQKVDQALPANSRAGARKRESSARVRKQSS